MAVLIVLSLAVVGLLTAAAIFARRRGGPSRSWVPLVLTVVMLPLGALLLLRLVSRGSSVVVRPPAAGEVSYDRYDPPTRDVRPPRIEPSREPLEVDAAAAVVELATSHPGQRRAAGGGPAAQGDPAPADWDKLVRSWDGDQDPHTSAETFYAFIVERVAAACDKVGGASAGPPLIVNHGVSPELVNRIAQRTAPPSVAGPASGPLAGATRIELSRENRTERRVSWWPKSFVKETVIARVTGPGGGAVVSAKLDEKPWLHEGTRFEVEYGAQRKGGEFVVAVSASPEGSAGDALGAARRAADQLLYPKVRQTMMESSAHGSRVSEAVLRQHVRQMAQGDVGVLDQCVVRVERRYGPVWYAAQLRKVSPDVVLPVAQGALHDSAERKQGLAAMFLGLGGMTLVLGVVYLGLNAATRGYFRGHLRAAVAVAGAAAVVAVLALKG